jgi:protein ImuB
MLMAFACIHIPDFMVQSVVRAERELRGSAIVLLDGKPPLWNVVAANAAAFEAGIQLGMTKSQATEFYGVAIRFRSEAQEKATHAALLDVGWSISPRVEDTAADTVVLDLDGLASLFGSDKDIAQELKQRVSRVGVVPHVAIASNIEAAILAARGFAGITIIPEGEESAHLGGLPVRTLSTDVEILETLDRWGVDSLRALAALPVLQLSERLGQHGVLLHEFARGARVRSLVLAEPQSTFKEEMELDDSVEELEPLSFLLGRLLDQLCMRLEARALAIRIVHIRFELELSFEKDVQTLNDESRKKTAPKEYTKVLTLPVPMRDAKVLLKLVRLSLQADPPKSPIKKISITADAAAPRVAQSGLFVPRGPDPEKLELTIARLAKLVGESNVGVAELLDTHRAENFRMVRWTGNTNSSAAQTGKSRKKNYAASHETEASRKAPATKPSTIGAQHVYPEPRRAALHLGTIPSITVSSASSTAPGFVSTGFRVIRPALAANVEIDEEKPVRVSFSGMQGDVVAASGPWRSSGEWWHEDGWDHDEWDLAIDFSLRAGSRVREKNPSPWPQYGLFRIYYDAPRKNWFVRGFYD